jgi:hypothetical protein
MRPWTPVMISPACTPSVHTIIKDSSKSSSGLYTNLAERLNRKGQVTLWNNEEPMMIGSSLSTALLVMEQKSLDLSFDNGWSLAHELMKNHSQRRLNCSEFEGHLEQNFNRAFTETL